MRAFDSQLSRWFTAGAVVLVVVFGIDTLMANIHAGSPQTRLHERLSRSGKFESLGFDWQASWSLQAMEEAPWIGSRHARVDAIDPFDGVMIINFWATWCEPCKAELPAMLQMAQEFSGSNVWWIFVSYDATWEAPQALLKRVQTQLHSHVVMLRDPDANPGGVQTNASLMHRLGTVKIPETYFVRDGHVSAKIVGAINWTHPDIKEYVRLLVAE